MRKTLLLLCVVLAFMLTATADPLDFRLTSMASGITFSNHPGLLQLAIGFGDCGLLPNHVFQVCTTGDGSSVAFGDGEYGLIPNDEGNQIQADYSSGGGNSGNFASGDSLGFFLKFEGFEVQGFVTDFIFTPLCHPQCNFVTLQATATADGLGGPMPISSLIQLPEGTDLVSLMNSQTEQSITGVVSEPGSFLLLSACIPLLLRKRRTVLIR